MRHIRIARTSAAVLAAAAVVVGCATGQGGSEPTADMLSGECNPLVTGGIGAVIGAIAGGNKRRGEGAAAGAAIGAPTPWRPPSHRTPSTPAPTPTTSRSKPIATITGGPWSHLARRSAAAGCGARRPSASR